MKKVITILLVAILCLSCIGCANDSEDSKADLKPESSQMMAICELAVLECYYHNVAKYYEKDADPGFLGIGKKDKHFWIEYSGVVRIGIDVSLVKVEVVASTVTVTLPEAKVLGCEVDTETLTKDSYIVAEGSAAVTAEDEMKAHKEAKEKMLDLAANDKVILANAKMRAKELIEAYILNVGSIAGKEFSINWIYVAADGSPLS